MQVQPCLFFDGRCEEAIGFSVKLWAAKYKCPSALRFLPPRLAWWPTALAWAGW